MKTTNSLRAVVATGLLLAAAATAGAVEAGGTVYSKRNETNLLTEPKPLATAAGKAGFAEALKVTEVRGKWYSVKGKNAAGWVFAGNVAEEKPKLAPAVGSTTLEASDTTTAAAARPLTEAGNDFAARHAGAQSRADVEWIDAQSGKIPGSAVVAYMKANKKGEFQE
jgi:hypothetical protein